MRREGSSWRADVHSLKMENTKMGCFGDHAGGGRQVLTSDLS